MTLSKSWKVILVFVLSFLGVACTSTQPESLDDPYETFNRHVFAFNQTIDKVALKPLATVYNFILPTVVRTGINNFFTNLDQVAVIANDLLQVDYINGGKDFWRFVINSTAGIGGLIDVAKPLGFAPHRNDLGLTLAKWGYKQSNYLILPILGPRTVRDSWGLLGDYTIFTVYPYFNNVALRNILLGVWLVEYRAELLRFEPTIKVFAFDQYVFERDAYLQHRNSIIQSVNEENNSSLAASDQLELSTAAINSVNKVQPKTKTTTHKK